MKIKETFDSLKSSCNDWRDYLANLQYCRKDNSITWNSYSGEFLRIPITLEDFYRMTENRQYSCQIAEDGGMVQIYYDFGRSGRKLLGASLAYFGILVEESKRDLESLNESIRWFRIDYQPDLESGVLHGACHMHLGGFPESRVLIRGVPTPYQFMEFLMATCYPNSYRNKRLTNEGHYTTVKKMQKINRKSFPIDRSDSFKYITHLRVPA